MNERIDDLAEQAAEFANADEYAGIERRIWQNVFRNKFAELIVKECVQYIEDKFDFCGDELIIAEKLKEHFGVE